MSEYYNPQRTRNLYVSESEKPFKLSRSKIDLFISCPLCFYLDRRLGVGRPPGFPFNLNSSVDALLKLEFDSHRVNGTRHPLIEQYGVDAIPIPHDDLDQWRHNFSGIQYLHEPTNFLIFGAIDDLWQNSKGELVVVDYKATSKKEPITELNNDWHIGYKRQMEVYQWLLRKNGYTVSNTGYFVYCNGQTDREMFDGKLDFEITLIPYTGSDAWVEETIYKIHECLNSPTLPDSADGCDYCGYRSAAGEAVSRVTWLKWVVLKNVKSLF